MKLISESSQTHHFGSSSILPIYFSYLCLISAFPSVTICNQNIYRKTVLARADPLALEVVRYSFPPAQEFSEGNKDPPDVNDPAIQEKLNKINVTQLALDNVQPINEMLLACKFRGSEINCTDHFSLIPTPFGWCYIFNSYDHVVNCGPYKTYGTGSAQGLYLRMNVNQSEYFYGTSTSAGFKVRGSFYGKIF